jgi:hypothetical protein
MDASGNVYVTGNRGDDTGAYPDSYLEYTTVKYDGDGNQLWDARYHGRVRDERATAMSLDASGNVYVTGSSRGSGYSYDYATVKYDGDGNELWVARYNDSANGLAAANAIALDASGNVYVTGAIGAIEGHYVTVKYTQ